MQHEKTQSLKFDDSIIKDSFQEELLTQTCYYWTGELQALAYSSYSDVSHPKSQ